MIGEILKAVLEESKEKLLQLGQSKGEFGTVILKADFKIDNMPSYAMPLVIIEKLGAEESQQYPGGLTRMDWMFGLNCYNYMIDGYGNDATGFSVTNINTPIDTIRQHFSLGKWLTPGMANIFDQYGFQFTLSGVQSADALEESGNVMGDRIVFDSTSMDNTTSFIAPSTSPLESIEQIDNPLYGGI